MAKFQQEEYRPDYYRLYPRPNLILLYKEPNSNYTRNKNLTRSSYECDSCKWIGRKSDLLNPEMLCPLCKSDRVKWTNKKPAGLSRNSSTKMKRALNWLVAAAETKTVFEKRYNRKVKWKVNFITLTIPAQGTATDQQCKRILNEFFKWAKYNHGLANYVWRAEAQARGDIHIHIVSDCYIHYSNLCFKWNNLLRKAGLLNGHENPNSTDIHAVLNEQVKNLKAYVVDYMMKKDKNADGTERRTINGRLWGCSKPLSNAGKQYQRLDENEAEQVHNLFKQSNWEVKQIENTSCYMYIAGRNENPYSLIDKQDDIYKLYSTELQLIKSHSVQLPLFERPTMAGT